MTIHRTGRKVGKQYSSLFHKPTMSRKQRLARRAASQAKAQAYAAAVARWEADNA